MTRKASRLMSLELQNGRKRINMGIYYSAVDYNEKKHFNAPGDFSIKFSGICHPRSPFPGMVVMKNARGSNFEICNDMYCEDWFKFEDISEQVYAEYLELFPWAKEFYEKEDK